ncbi:hypothetical protein F5884DRAFT_814730 [Xylogone sp. PMI_703]|nr:hypothetical protein F5884DRAFT_814730 [Xylogone sp. PMI_703]
MPNPSTILRLSHVKSKAGCYPCKMRRVKCDEFRPNCLRCTNRGDVCEYKQIHDRPVSSCDLIPDLVWPAMIDEACGTWKTTGEPPFPHLTLMRSLAWHQFDLKELRYLYYHLAMASILQLSGMSSYCHWWTEFSTFVKIAIEFKPAAFALVALSAERMAAITKHSRAYVDAARYRIQAARTLNDALASFSRESANAILCTGILLAHQQNDWRSWRAAILGVVSILNNMDQWIDESIFARYFTTPRAALIDGYPQAESLLGLQKPIKRFGSLETLLSHGLSSLNQLSTCTKERPNIAVLVRRLRDVMRIIYNNPLGVPQEEQWRLIFPFAFSQMEPVSPTEVRTGDTLLAIVLAHRYAIFVAVCLALQSINLGSIIYIRVRSVVAVWGLLENIPYYYCAQCGIGHSIEELMKFPLSAVEQYIKHSEAIP